ncbi:uncharacterized protein LOC123272964 [Cotesia glomerata]|nr:uncharacterized protein LOC123272964 [Cotesia glomerata]
MDFLPKLKGISRLDKGTQLVALFKNLQEVMQPFCKSELELLARTMYKMKTSGDRADHNIFAYNKNGTKIKYHEIDMFTDIGYQTMLLLQSKTVYKPAEKDYEINRSFGREFSALFHLIKNGKILLTQPVLAALTANMKFVDLPADQIEDLRFLIDVLRGNKIKNWSPELIGSAHMRNPQVLIDNMFRSLASNNDVDPLVSDIAAGLQGKLQRTYRSYMTKVMEPFFGEEELNITLVFKVMRENVQNESSVDLLKKLFDDKTINAFYAMKGFVRYYFNTPVKLVIGFLRRLQLRVPINNEIMGLISSIINELSNSSTAHSKDCSRCLKGNQYNGNHRQDDGKKDSSQKSEDNRQKDDDGKNHSSQKDDKNESSQKDDNKKDSSQKDDSNRQKDDDKKDSSQKDDSNRQKDDGEKKDSSQEAKDGNNRPENSEGKKVRQKNRSQKGHEDPSDYQSFDDEKGDETKLDNISKRQLYRIKNELIKPRLPINQVCNRFNELTTPSFRFNIIGNLTSNCLEPAMPSMNWFKNIDQPAYNFVLKPLIAQASTFLSEFIDENDEIGQLIEDVLINVTQSASRRVILKAVSYPGSVRQLLTVLFKKMINVNKVRARSLIYFEVIKIYCKLINDHDNRSHAFDASLFKLDDPVRNNSIDQFKSVVSFSLQKLIDGYNVSSHSAIFWNNYTTNRLLISDLCRVYLTHRDVVGNDRLFNEVVFILHSVYHVPVRFADLLSIYTAKTVYEIRNLNLAQDLLMKPNMMQMLGDDFDLGRYPTKGAMLKAVFIRLKNQDIVRRNATLLTSVESQLREITCDGHWMESSEEILAEALTDQVDLDKVFDLGLDEKKLSPNVKNAFLNMWNWYGGIFNPINFIKKMNISGYDTRSAFIQGFLNSITQIVADDYVKVIEDVKLMRSAVLESGNGLDPIDFL